MQNLTIIFLFAGTIVLGWYLLEAWKVKHGYPVTDDEGNVIEPTSRPEDKAEIERLRAENDEMRGRLEAIGDRVETLERIATDKPSRLAAEIDALASLSDKKEETSQ